MNVLFLTCNVQQYDLRTAPVPNLRRLRAIERLCDVRVVSATGSVGTTAEAGPTDGAGSGSPAAAPVGTPVASHHSVAHRVRQAVWQLVATWIPDIVLCDWPQRDWPTAVSVSQLLGVPAVVAANQNGSAPPSQAADPADLARAFRDAGTAVACTPSEAKTIEAGGVPRERIKILPKLVEGEPEAWATELLQLIRPMVSSARDPDWPRWATWGPRPAGGKEIQPSIPRQIVRRLMELLPDRLFFTRCPRTSPSVYLTFDDGPHPVHTPRLLDELARLKVQATFFVVGRQVVAHPQLVRRIASEGHTVANHTFLHSDLRLSGASEAVTGAELLRRHLRDLLGNDSRLYRPPRGKVSFSQALRLWRAGYTIVLWSADARDWACHTAEDVREWARRHPFRAGDIVLMHDRLPYAAQALADIVAAAIARGLRLDSLRDR